MSKRRESSLFQGLILGAIIGGGLVYYLMATEEGKKTQKKIKAKKEEVFNQIREMAEDLETQRRVFKKKAKKIKNELKEKTKEAKREVLKEDETSVDNIKKLQKKGRAAAQKFFTKNGRKLS